MLHLKGGDIPADSAPGPLTPEVPDFSEQSLGGEFGVGSQAASEVARVAIGETNPAGTCCDLLSTPPDRAAWSSGVRYWSAVGRVGP